MISIYNYAKCKNNYAKFELYILLSMILPINK